MLFCDLCDYTSLTESCEPEEAAELKRYVEGLAVRTITAHGGAITQVYGDGILAVFGFPQGAEDDVRRSVDAALELRRLTHEQIPGLSLPPGFELRMHFGIHSGMVLVHAGDPLHGRYELTGDAVNTTSRLCSAAERDEILVSADALSGLAALYRTDLVPEMTLKGKRSPVRAYRIHAPSGVTTRFEARRSLGLTRFAGRSHEIEQLDRALRDLERGGRRAIRLWGPAGIGKTRLVEELAQLWQARQVHVLRGYCDGYGNPPPLQAFSQVLRQLFRIRGEMPKERAQESVLQRLSELDPGLPAQLDVFLRLLGLLPWSTAPHAVDMKRTILDAVAALFAALRGERPLVIMIDDWQWSDELSRQAIGAALASAAGGLLVLMTARAADSDVAFEEHERIEVRPFQPAESAQVIRSLMPNELDVGLSRVLHERSGGNPLFLEELCRTLPAGAGLGPELDPSSVPHELHAVIQTRLGRLPAEAQRLLRVAAVAGNELDVPLIERIAECSDVHALLSQLISHDLIRRAEDGVSYRFKHGITREVVYKSVLRAERRALHRAIALALEEAGNNALVTDRHEALAHHYVGSGDHERAVHYAVLAGDKAASASSLDRASSQYRTALLELDRLPSTPDVRRRWLRVCTKWARVLVYNPMSESLRMLERAARYAAELSDLSAGADVAQLSAWLCYAMGDQANALEHCRVGLQIAEWAADGKLVGQLLSNMGQVYAAAGRYAAAHEHLDRALQLKQTNAIAPRTLPVGFAYALGCKALIYADIGSFQEAYPLFDQAIAVLRRAGHPVEGSVHGLLGMALLWQERWAEAIESCAHASATASRVGFRYVVAMAQGMEGHGRFVLDGSREGLEALRRSAVWLESSERTLFLSCVQAFLAEALQRDGQHAAAVEYAERALKRAERMDPLGGIAALRVLARERMRTGDNAAAEELLARATHDATERGSRRELGLIRLARAELHVQHGESAEARSLLITLRPELLEMGLETSALSAQRLLARLAEEDRLPA